MENLKKYEEFEYQEYFAMASAGMWTLYYLLNKFLFKKILDSANGRSLKKILLNDKYYTTKKWAIEDDGNCIYMSDGSSGLNVNSYRGKLIFTLYKSERILKFENYSERIKLNKKECDELVSNLEFVKCITSDFKDYTYELTDRLFSVAVSDIDFVNRKFWLTIMKDSEELTKFDICTIKDEIDQLIYIINNKFTLKIDSSFAPTDVYAGHFIVQSYDPKKYDIEVGGRITVGNNIRVVKYKLDRTLPQVVFGHYFTGRGLSVTIPFIKK